LCSVIFFLENRVVYKTMCKKYCRAGQTTDGAYVVACWMSKSTHTHTQVV